MLGHVLVVLPILVNSVQTVDNQNHKMIHGHVLVVLPILVNSAQTVDNQNLGIKNVQVVDGNQHQVKL